MAVLLPLSLSCSWGCGPAQAPLGAQGSCAGTHSQPKAPQGLILAYCYLEFNPCNFCMYPEAQEFQSNSLHVSRQGFLFGYPLELLSPGL